MFWESAVEQNNEIMDASYHINCTNSPSAALGKLGSLNISNAASSTLNELASDHMSFYDEEEAEALALQRTEHDHHLWRMTDDLLLPEEGPAQRFRVVVEKSSSKCFQRKSLHHVQNKTSPSSASSSASSSSSSSTMATTTTSTRSGGVVGGAGGFRVFNSLSSSCSMESSIDDEYLELFEMESLEEELQQQHEQENSNKTSLLSLPSNLNSLISGQIKSSLTRTPEIQRPSARRCLRLSENQNEQEQQQQQLPKTPDQSLKNAKISNEDCTTPLSYTSKLSNFGLERSPFSPFCFKRPDPPSVTNSPVQTKRYRGDEKENFEFNFIQKSSSTSNCTYSSNTHSSTLTTTTTTTTTTSSTRVPYRKSMSMNDAEIMSALARSESLDEPDLIGDFSKPFALPLIEGHHRDLKTISSDTVARLINGEFENQVANYVIVDCRYPYEYEGGHIRGAKNLYTQEQIMEEFLSHQKTESKQQQQQQQQPADNNNNKRNIIIFHCEFSSKRGPRLSRFLRNIDRARNTNAYPTLDYPEIYLLHNGYKEFYETHAELCDPTAYCPMLEPAYSDAYRHFRAKSKSWNGDSDGLGGTTTRLKKSRSRLML